MRILVLGAFNDGALENYYVKGLRVAGANCTTFDIAHDYYTAINHSVINKAINKLEPAFFFEKINKKLLRFLSTEQFDVIIVFKGLTLYSSTIEALKKNTRLLCCYNPDHPFKFFSPGSGNKNILNSIKKYDIYFTYSKNICNQLKQDWKIESYVIPFGYDDSQINHSASTNNAYTNKWLFIGTYDRERSAWLRELRMDNLHIYGDSKWASKHNAYINKAYQGKALYNEEYKIANRDAAGIINLLRKQNIEEGSHNMRTFEVPGYGGLLIANRTEEQQFFFEEGKEAVYFDTIEELKDKLSYLQGRPDVVLSVKTAASKRADRSGYTYTHRSAEMYQVIKKYL